MILAEIPRIEGKKGSKRHLLVDEHGVPLSIVVTGANKHDTTQLAAALWHKISNKKDARQNLCADAGYTGEQNRYVAKVNNYKSFIKQRGKRENKRINKIISSKRWVVEACHSWFNRFRKVLIRYEKKSSNYLALCMLAAAIITLNKIGIIYG